MGLTKDQLLARLKELHIGFAQYEHPVVLTVEEQAKYVGDKGGALTKNLFLKDKKSRYYMVSALADAKVDMKILSQRLGLGKGGIRMAPEGALGEILQVPLGCVTPFALINETARHVSLLLDKGFKTQDSCFFHPLSNDVFISLKASDLDKFLNSVGRDPAYVDLEANPTVGKDQPPDLAALVPSDTIAVPDAPENAEALKAPTASVVPGEKKSSGSAVKATNLSGNTPNPKDKPSPTVNQPSAFSDAELFVEEVLSRTSALLLSQIKKEMMADNIKGGAECVGTEVAKNVRERLSADLKNLAIMYKNTAYTQGFHAGKSCEGRQY